MTQIKICGLTRLDDALACVDNGVGLLGLNFYPASPRFLENVRAEDLVSKLDKSRKDVKLVGVFVDRPIAEIESITRACGLDAVQLHGNESVEDVIELRAKGIFAFKAFRGSPSNAILDPFIFPYQDLNFPNALIDTYHPGLFGGTGEVMNSDQLGAFINLRNSDPSHRYLLAGGLKPENVAKMIAITQPWGVDTASGVEASPGIKDHQKIINFCRAVRVESI